MSAAGGTAAASNATSENERDGVGGSTEFLVGMPAKERYPRDYLFTVTDNFQFLRDAGDYGDELKAVIAGR